MPLSAETARRLESALKGLRFGCIQLVVHDAKIVRLERIEKIRLTDATEAATDETHGRPTLSREARRISPLEGSE